MDRVVIAEHLLNNSYPALKDPKILLSVVQNLLDAIEERVTASLEEARKNHEIPPYSDTLNGKLTAYRMHLAKKKGVHPVDFMLVSELQELLTQHDSAPVEFRRKDALVIADADYRLSTLTKEKTKTYIERTKSLLTRA